MEIIERSERDQQEIRGNLWRSVRDLWKSVGDVREIGERSVEIRARSVMDE